MAVGLSNGQSFPDEAEYWGSIAAGMPLGSPEKPAGALKSDGGTDTPGNTSKVEIEDRRNESLPSMLSSWVGSQLTSEKIQAILSHPMAKPSQTISANQPVTPSFLGNDLGLQDLPEKPIPDFTNQYGTPDDKKIWPERLVDSAISAVTLPGDAWQGKVDPNSLQGRERALELATLMIGGPAPVASKMADGTLGSFAGVGSKTLNKIKLYEAQGMKLEGESQEAIWRKTGFFEGADGLWRYEIPDSGAVIKEGKLKVTEPAPLDPNTPKGWKSAGDEAGQPTYAIPEQKRNIFGEITKDSQLKLGDIYDHPELYKAYPDLANVKVHPLPPKVDALAMAKGGELYMSAMPASQFEPILAHEVQHLIQRREGFARGGSSEEFTPAGLKEAAENFKNVKANTEAELSTKYPEHDFNALKYFATMSAHGKEAEIPKNLKEHWEPVVQKAKDEGDFVKLENNAKSEKLLADQADKQHELYRSIMGEVESRNVETRLRMGTMERFLRSPQSTEDIARSDQIHKGVTGLRR